MIEFEGRIADYPIDASFLERWSPRAFTEEEIPQRDLLTMLEAARWAASSYNAQPWRFVYARRGTEQFVPMLALLNDFNQSWARHAAALVIFVSNSVTRSRGSDKEVPSHSHSFDAGAASGNFALQANKMGWFVHGMVGFDLQRTFVELQVPTGYRVEAAFAVGRRGDKSMLPIALQGREAPSPRRPLSELAFEGKFPGTGCD